MLQFSPHGESLFTKLAENLSLHFTGAIAYRDMRSLQWPVQACFAERRTKLAIDLCGHADCFVGLLLGHIVELWLSGVPGKAASAVPDVGEKPV